MGRGGSSCGALGISLGSFLVLGVGAIWVLRERAGLVVRDGWASTGEARWGDVLSQELPLDLLDRACASLC